MTPAEAARLKVIVVADALVRVNPYSAMKSVASSAEGCMQLCDSYSTETAL